MSEKDPEQLQAILSFCQPPSFKHDNKSIFKNNINYCIIKSYEQRKSGSLIIQIFTNKSHHSCPVNFKEWEKLFVLVVWFYERAVELSRETKICWGSGAP